jgi:exonuclease SbcC
MIPLTLRIQNFLSYGSPVQTIDFSHYKLICLSGKNGHGKSALLDAMTWALWGQARKTGNTSKADTGVVKLGQTDVMVIFDFIFNNQGYRVKRVFSTKYGKPKAHVDFGTYNTKTDYFTPLTEKTIRKTQECIDKTLGLTYEAFINSSFLRQGQANEFSKKSPKDRKEILASILGLNRYEKAKKLALEQVRKTGQEKEHLEKLANHIAKECEQSTEIEKNVVTVIEQLKTLIQKELTAKNAHEQLEINKQLLEKKQQDYKLLLFEQEQKQLIIKKQQETFKTLTDIWKQTDKKLTSAPDKTTLEKKRDQLAKKLEDEHLKLKQNLTHKEEFLRYKEQEQELLYQLKQESAVELQNKALSLERLKTTQTSKEEVLRTIEQEVKNLHKENEACTVSIEDLKKTVNPTYLISDTQELQQTFERYKEYYQKWIEQGNWIASERKSLAGKQSLSQDTANPSCPLCEQNLSQARKRFLHKKFEDQNKFLNHRLERLKNLIGKTKATLHEQHAALEASKKIDALFKKQTELNTYIQTKEKQYAEVSKNIKEENKYYKQQIQDLKEQKVKIEQQVSENKNYLVVKKKREEAEKQSNGSKLQEDSLKKLENERTQIDQQLKSWHSLEGEKNVQLERKKQIETLDTQIQQEQIFEKTITLKCKQYSSLEAQVKKHSREEQDLTAHTAILTKEKELLFQEKGSLENQQKKLIEQAKLQKECKRKAREQETYYQEYQAIAQALSKDGIQALLIEEALPEIEQEANELLSRLTDNQTHIFIESLRDLKKGGTRETLDINISDSNGIRPYEMFSGGEAFRLDFALRIALSKLLARRAGTSLQTLIIDEGFGSQDEEGLSRIMDVLYKIQDDFEKIIIVSHLSSMKDQFPVHFIVDKQPQGSRVTVKELG